MAIGEIDIAAQVNAAVTRELARMTAELQASSYENIGQGGSRGHSVDWFDAADDSGSGMDTDKVYIGGIEYTPGANANDYDFIKIGADGSSSFIPAMISPMPTGYEIFNIRKNHIHITGATAGNI